MEFITSQFRNFTFVSYLTFAIIVLTFFLAGNLNSDRKNSPMFPLIIANVSFWFFIGTIPGNFDTYSKIIFFLSGVCICWYWIIKVNENQENEDRGFLRSGKETVANSYNSAKEALKNKGSETVGGGFLGDLLGSAVDIGTRKTDGKLSGFLGLFGNSDEYFHPSRGTINTLRNLLIIAIFIIMLYIS